MNNENAPDQATEPQAADEHDKNHLFPVVGIGASAGGLEALRAFLDHVPARSGMAFVVVVHLSPEHQSRFSELLQSHTRMPVIQVSELVEIEPDHVYVIPPNRNLSTIDSHLRLSALEQARAQRAPIDHFLRTLADSHGQRAIGVILSGSGSDGAVGLKRVKEAGGLVIAQDPTEAAYDGMPQSAIATGLVDYTLPVSEIPGRMLAYVRHEPPLRIAEDEDALSDEDRAILYKIFAQLRAVVGHDFSHYKPATILRRIRRRMQLRGVTTLAAYLEVLRAEHTEQDDLFKDLLITVTNFFREKESYDALQREVIPQLFAGKEAGEPVRVWVPGCATGEEAYSLAILHALRPGGYLFLGTSESVDDIDLFRAVDKKHSIYQRQNVASAERRLPSLPMAAPDVHRWLYDPGRQPARPQPASKSYGGLHQQLAEQFAPPSVLVNEDHTIVHLSQHAGRYLQHPGGEPTDNILKLVRDELRLELATLLYRAREKARAVRSNLIPVSLEGESRLVSLYAQPAREEDGQTFVLVFFLESEVMAGERAGGRPPGTPDALVRELEEELAETKERLRLAIEEFEGSKEEMKAANEELLSMNEELRSTTEELETSKEELQSINEELVTVNEENKNKVEELSQLTGDLQNLLAATDIATLFLDRQLRIQRFTPAANELFNVMMADRGRPLSHLTHKLVNYDNLLEDATAVLKRLAPIEQEVTSQDGRSYLMRLLPYLSVNGRIDGVVVTFIDITTIKETEKALRQSQERNRLIVEGVKEYAIFTMDEEGRIDSWNQGAKRIFGYDIAKIIGKPGAIIFTEEDRQAGEVEKELERARTEGQAMSERWHVRQDGSRFWGSGVVTSLADDQLRGYAKVMRDNTLRKAAEEQLRQSQERLQALNETLEERVRQRTEQVRALASELVISEQRIRHRISKALHDDLQQLLYALEMQLQLYRDDLDEATLAPKSLAGLNQIVDMVQTSIHLSRQLTVEISPPVLQGEGLAEAVKWLARHMQEVYGLEVEIETGDHPPRVTNEERRILLFQVVRELLFNVVEHAGVEQARVTLQEQDGGLGIEVVDQGQGFDVDETLAAPATGSGLHNARERLQLFDGYLEIDSQPGAGARVRVVLPRQQPETTIQRLPTLKPGSSGSE